jgi:hypothetical protein
MSQQDQKIQVAPPAPLESQFALLSKLEATDQKELQRIEGELKNGGFAALVTGKTISLQAALKNERAHLAELKELKDKISNARPEEYQSCKNSVRALLIQRAKAGMREANKIAQQADITTATVESVDKGLESGVTMVASRMFTPVVGAAFGGYYSTLRHGAEAAISVATGEKSREEAVGLAKARISEGLLSVGTTALGVTVAGKVGSTLLAKGGATIATRASVGAVGALAAMGVSTPLQLGYQYYQANQEFQSQAKGLPPTERHT